MNENLIQYIKNKFSVIETEIWNFNNNDTRTVDPGLQKNRYGYGMGIYRVPTHFCRNQ